MSRRLVVLAPLLLLAIPGCRGADEESEGAALEVSIPLLPADAKGLTLTDAHERRYFYFRLLVRSHAKRAVALAAQLAADAPEGMTVSLKGETEVPREGSANPVLVLTGPTALGDFATRVTVTSAALPGWSHGWDVTGNVIRYQPKGRQLKLRPAGVELGAVKPGQRCPFTVALVNEGTEDIRISRVQSLDQPKIDLRAGLEGELIVAGAELQLNGTVTAPKDPGGFTARLRIHSDAQNSPQRDIVIGGTVEYDYETLPERLPWTMVYAPDQPVAVAEVRARPGVDPFTIASVEGIEPYFELASRGTEEPAPQQRIQLRLRPDAPTGPAKLRLRIRIAPDGGEVPWTAEFTVVPSIVAEPAKLNFGKARAGESPLKRIELRSFSRRAFKVNSVRSERGVFRADARSSPALPWTIVVQPVAGLRAGPNPDKLIIETDDPDTPEIHVSVYIEIVP